MVKLTWTLFSHLCKIILEITYVNCDPKVILFIVNGMEQISNLHVKLNLWFSKQGRFVRAERRKRKALMQTCFVAPITAGCWSRKNHTLFLKKTTPHIDTHCEPKTFHVFFQNCYYLFFQTKGECGYRRLNHASESLEKGAIIMHCSRELANGILLPAFKSNFLSSLNNLYMLITRQ